jgi:putative DNA primase/helicase
VASAKFESEVQFTPSFTLLLAANDSPTVRDDDDGLWKRMRRIPLTTAIPPEQQDPTVKMRLREPEHAEAVLAWAVAGCLAYQQHGLGTCASVEASTAEYRVEMDHFGEFLADACTFEQDARLTRKALRALYKEWAEETGRRVLLGSREIARRLRQRGCEERIVMGNRQWVGIRERATTDPATQVQIGAACTESL